MKGGSLSGKERCWDCGKHAPAFIRHPASQNYFCAACAANHGLDLPVEPSTEGIGTIEYPDGRVEKREIDA